MIIIPCAGKSSRMEGNIPKMLKKINGDIALNQLVSKLFPIFSEIVIVINPGLDSLKKFSSSIEKKYLKKITFSESFAGRGDGGAIIDAFKNYKFKNNEFFYVCWGDSFISDTCIIRDLKKVTKSSEKDVLIPLISEQDPYVEYKISKNNVNDILLSRLGEITSKNGYTDQSIFSIRAGFFKKYFTEGHITGKFEINFLKELKLFLEDKNVKINCLKSKKRNIFSFNTIGDIKNIMRLNLPKN